MIKSIRYFLLISLLLSITLASAINGIGNYVLDEKVVQPFLDRQLMRVASFIDILNQSEIKHVKIKAHLIDYIKSNKTLEQRNLSFQVWDLKGKLLLHSTDSLSDELKDAPFGFSDKNIQGGDWRIYVSYDARKQTKIIVAELYNLRRDLADAIVRSNTNILLVTYPVFALLVWLIINFALKSISRVTTEIANRASTFLEPVQNRTIPVEIKPLVGELNQLFLRLKLAFERNKRFSADAAHELRTPLAALKTHVQVALKASNDLDRTIALQKVIESVDRSSHVVDQLLTLSRLGDERLLNDIKPFNLHKLAMEMIAYVAPNAIEKNIEIGLSPPPAEPIILGNDTAVGILIRNIVDNAIRYTPQDGEVKIDILNVDDHVILRVTDTGTGIPLELRERVFERFYRILGTSATGSGLGLAIVTQIANLHHAEILLNTPENGIGLQFDVAFPKYHA